MRGMLVMCAVAVGLSMGCTPNEMHVGMVPALMVSPPDGEPESPDYLGVSFGTHWGVGGLEVSTNSAHRDAGEMWTTPNIRKNMTTVAGTLWLGWQMAKYENEDAKWWIVCRPSAGAYYWGEGDDKLGLMTGLSAGTSIHLNDYNTIGVEYQWRNLYGTHGGEDTETEGLNFTYTIVFK